MDLLSNRASEGELENGMTDSWSEVIGLKTGADGLGNRANELGYSEDRERGSVGDAGVCEDGSGESKDNGEKPVGAKRISGGSDRGARPQSLACDCRKSISCTCAGSGSCALEEWRSCARHNPKSCTDEEKSRSNVGRSPICCDRESWVVQVVPGD